MLFFYTCNASTVVAITGKTATPEGKQAAVKVSFKAKKTKKISKYSYVSKVTVAEDKLTMTAEATHANEIVATFNKAVGSDAKVTLKKGTADVANTAKIAEDGKSATITLTGKLSDGTYTVTVVAADQTVTADVVAKNEVLTSFEIGSTLKEETKADSSKGATAKISYQALNQYGDKINYVADKNSVTISIGKVTKTSACKTSEAGTITVEDIPSMYAIPGQSFTVVIVDTVNNTGVTLNKTAVYGASATATEFTSAGVYSMAKSAFRDVADGDKIADYELLFTVKDQYGDDMGAKDVAIQAASDGAIQVTIAGGLTNIKANDDKYKDKSYNENVVEIGDTTYFAVPFAAAGSTSNADNADKANAGTYTVTIVNNTKGIVYTGEYTVTSGTVISSIQISQKDTIYAGQDNELEYVVTDTNGKDITDYDTLKSVKVTNNSKNDEFSWKQNSNGTAKLIYKPAKMDEPDLSKAAARDYTKSEIRSCTIEANKAESGKLLVKSQTFTVYYQRTPLSVSGLASNAASVTTNAKGTLDVELKNLVVLDQYQNPYSESDLKNAYGTIGKDILVSVKAANGATVKIGSTTLTEGSTATAMSAKIEMSGITNKVKLNFVVANNATVASKTSTDGVDVTFTKGDARKISGLYVDSVNCGCALRVDGIQNKAILYKCDDSASGKYGKDRGEKPYTYDSNSTTYYAIPNNIGSVVVKGIVNGKKVVVDPTQYEFVGAEASGDLYIDGVQSYDLAQKVITETREFTIVVSTDDGPQTITGKVDVSNAPAVAKTISANAEEINDTISLTATKDGKIFTKASADALFTMKNQYNSIDNGSALYTYTVESVTVSGDAVTYDGKEVKDGSELSASVLTPYLNGSNNNYLTLDKKVVITGSDAIVAKVVVEGTVDKSDAKDKTASKTITLTITQ